MKRSIVVLISICSILTTEGICQSYHKALRRANNMDAYQMEQYCLQQLKSIDSANTIRKKAGIKGSRNGEKQYVGMVCTMSIKLGTLYLSMGDNRKANTFFQKIDSVQYNYYGFAHKLTWASSRQYTIAAMQKKDVYTEMYIKHGNLRVARQMIFTPYYNNAENATAMYYAANHQYDSSATYYEKYILKMENRYFFPSDAHTLGKAYVSMGEVHCLNGNYKAALRVSKHGNRILHHRWAKKWNPNTTADLFRTQNNISEIYRISGKENKSYHWSDKAEKTLRKMNNDYLSSIKFLSNKALLFWTKGNTDSAFACFKKMNTACYNLLFITFPYLAEHERSYVYTQAKPHIDYARSFYLQQIIENSYLKDECSKYLLELNINTKGVLLSSSRNELNKINQSQDTTAIRVYKEIILLKNKVSYASSKQGENNKQSIDLLMTEIELKEKFLHDYLNISPEQFISSNTLLSSIPDSTQLVDVEKCYRISKNEQGVLFLPDSSVYVYFISNPARTEFTVKYNSNGTAMDGRQYKYYFNAVRMKILNTNSYNAYWKDIESDIHCNKVIFSGDGVYNLINPAVLYDGEKYLLQKYQLYQISASKDLCQKLQHQGEISTVTMLGRPDFTTYSSIGVNASAFPADLPGTESEVLAICASAPTSIQCEVKIGLHANENTVKEISSPSILHLATHGYFEELQYENPLFSSGLLLSISNPELEDGHLTAYEASSLHLKNTSLVVLSACESGMGVVFDGDGVWGLQRSFQIAGVNYVVMSLVKVNDEVTSKLMINFYQNLFNGQAVYNAFRNAQLSIMKEYPQPLYWGAFVIKGM